ncbi:hypothetical protein OAM69_04590 [bacterium]|nr:hypothetical protein [bacterium]
MALAVGGFSMSLNVISATMSSFLTLLVGASQRCVNFQTLPPIFPKLWRRIQGFQRDESLFDPEQPFANFKQWVELEKPERVIVSSADSITKFDNVIETTDDTVMLTVDSHDVSIISV